MQLAFCGNAAIQPHKGGAAGLRGKKFAVALHGAAHILRGGQLQLVHPHRDQIRAELAAVQFNVQQPVVLQIVVGEGVVDKIVAVGVVVLQLALGGKAVCAVQHQQFSRGRHKIRHGVGKFAFFVMPEHDAAGVKIRQRRIEHPRQLLGNGFGVHSVLISQKGFPRGGSCHRR